MSRRNAHHISPARTRNERVYSLLDEIDFEAFLLSVLSAMELADETGENAWVVREGLNLKAISVAPDTAKGEEFRYIMLVRAREKRLVGAQRLLDHVKRMLEKRGHA